MIRGADTQFVFNMSCKCSDLDYATISFWQPENRGPSIDRPLPIVKALKQCFATDLPNQLCVVLDREETLRFSDKRKAYVQLRGTTKDGVTFVGKQKTITVYPAHDESLVDGISIPTPTHEYVYFDGQNIGASSDDGVTYMDGRIIK